MREADFAEFSALLDAVCSLLSRGAYVPNATNTALWFRALQAHDLATVRAAFDAHVKDPERGRFVPTPADVIAQIAGPARHDGRPGAEEAWAVALRAGDESDTVVWTAEMAEAWAIARGVWDAGDEVGARMAFREAYTRLVEDARRDLKPVVWTVSLGFDADKRVLAITAAVRAGRLPREELLALPAPARGDVLLLPAESANAHAARQRLKELADAMRNAMDRPSGAQLEHERTLQLKAHAAQLAAQHATAGSEG